MCEEVILDTRARRLEIRGAAQGVSRQGSRKLDDLARRKDAEVGE